MSFKKHRLRLEQKFQELKENYDGKIIVVLTNSDYKERYKTILKDDFPLFLRTELESLFSAQIDK